MPLAARDTYPELWVENYRYLRAFWLLDAGRPEGFSGAPPIPTIDVAIHARETGFDYETLLRRVRAGDREVRKWAKDQADEKKRQKGA